MTEEEAKTKWCPFANAHGDSMVRGISPSRMDGVWNHTLCIGSACMAWRREPLTDAMTHDDAGSRGYCGLAGEP